jgi:hypothetical protein
MVLFADTFIWVPKHTKDTLFISAILGYLCAGESFILSALTKCVSQYRQVKEDPSDMCISEREMRPISPLSTEVPNHTHTLSDLPNHHQFNKISNKRPDESLNQRPSLGNTKKTNHRYRQGYHYQPIASTSRQSPTFVLEDAILAGPSSSKSNV